MLKQKQKGKKTLASLANTRGKPIPSNSVESSSSSKAHMPETTNCSIVDLQPVKEKINETTETQQVDDENKELYKSEVERFIEVSKYFSNPLRKTASYISENSLVSYPNPFLIQYKRGGISTQNLKFCNLTLEPVFIKLYKLIPDLEQIKFINLSLSRCKRIPPGLSFSLGFVYDDVNERPTCNAKMVFVASRKTTTPCYQICEIDLRTEAHKIRLVET